MISLENCSLRDIYIFYKPAHESNRLGYITHHKYTNKTRNELETPAQDPRTWASAAAKLYTVRPTSTV